MCSPGSVQGELVCSGLCQEINLWWRKEKRLPWGGIWLEIDVTDGFTDGFSLMCRSVRFWLLSQRWFAPRVGRRLRLSTLLRWWVNATLWWAFGVAGSSGCREKTGTPACRDGERQPWTGERASVILKWLGKAGGISYMILVKQNPVLSLFLSLVDKTGLHPGDSLVKLFLEYSLGVPNTLSGNLLLFSL